MSKFIGITSFFIALSVFFSVSSSVEARKGPPPLFDRPIKLDDSGRPLYNSWERQEYQRKYRQRKNPRLYHHDGGQTPSKPQDNKEKKEPSDAAENRI